MKQTQRTYVQPKATRADNEAIVRLTIGDVWGDGTGYQLLIDADNQGWDDGYGPACGSTYANWEYMIPNNASANDANVIINATGEINIPAGTYSYLILNPSCGSSNNGRNYIASDNCDESNASDFEFEAGKIYTFTVALNGENDCVTLTVENIPTVPTLQANASELSFIAETNTSSDAQAVVVSTFNLTAGITATVTAPFEVSADNTTFGTTASLTTAGGPLYVRYSPTTAGDEEGTMTIASEGATSLTVALSGSAYSCDARTAPWTETFNTNSVSAYCWGILNANLDNKYYRRMLVEEGSEEAFMSLEVASTSHNDWLISPELTIAENNYVEFQVSAYTTVQKYSVYAIHGEDTTLLRETAQTSSFYSDFETITIGDLSAYVGQNIKIAIVCTTAAASSGYFFIDNFSLKATPTTPEIALTSVTPANNARVNINESFSINGVVTNNGCALTGYTVSYKVDEEDAVEYTVSDINVAFRNTHNFTHDTPITLTTTGDHTIVIVVSNPNGTEDNAEDDTLRIRVRALDCGTPITEVFTEDFEDTLEECWTIMSMNTANEAKLGIYAIDTVTPNSVFRFSSYSSADNYNQYLITPKLGFENAVKLSFKYAGSNSSAEKFVVLTSSTDNNIESFSAIGDTISSTNQYATYEAIIPANTKYIAINYFSNDMYYLYVDNFAISELPANEIALKNVAFTTETGCGLETTQVKATVKNEGTGAISTFTLSYSVNEGEAVEETVTPAEPIATDATYEYTFTEGVNISETGTYTIEVTATLEGDADDTNNTAEASISNLVPARIPYENTFDTEEELLGMSFIDANNDGIQWQIYTLDEDTGDKVPAILSGNAQNGNNDYFVTSCISLAAGTYRMTVDIQGGGQELDWNIWDYVYYYDDLSIVYGNAPTAEALTNQIFDTTHYLGANTIVKDFTVAEDGTYYIGFKSTSENGRQSYINNLSITKVAANDITVTKLTLGTNITCSTSTNDVIVTVKNNGLEPISAFSLEYSVNNGTPVSEEVTLETAIVAGESYEYTFTNPISVDEDGEYVVVVTATLANEENTTDNTKTRSFSKFAPSTIPYTEDFTNANNFATWSIIDANDDDNTWVYDDEEGTVNYNYSSTENANDWLFTPCLDFTAGTYKLEFNYSASSSYPESVKIFYGTVPTIEAMTNVIVDMPSITGTSTAENNFTISTDGIYFIGFHCYSEADMYYISIADVHIEATTTSVEENIASAIAVYPNPANDVITIANAEGQNIVIVNTLGQVVSEINNAAANQTIDISNLANGTYFVKVNAEVVKINVVK